MAVILTVPSPLAAQTREIFLPLFSFRTLVAQKNMETKTKRVQEESNGIEVLKYFVKDADGTGY